jgi:hypothetical protein
VGLRVLITNNTLAARAGSELYVRDLATALLRRGHTPIVYSTELGTVAEELRLATIPATDDLRSLAHPPDIIHGHHHLDTMTALLHFPHVPCVYFCHGWLPWEEAAPRFPRIYQYVAVDHTCRDRLLYHHGIPEHQIEVLLNFVDLEKFQPRPRPLPTQPKRALVFSNAASRHHLHTIQHACEQLGITVDVAGIHSGQACAQPEQILGNYDLVFAKARAALEAMSVGASVILCDAVGAGALVTTNNFDQLRPLNFGIRALQDPISVAGLRDKILGYDPADAAKVSQRIRETAGQEAVVEQVIRIYQKVLTRSPAPASIAASLEANATAVYLRWLAPRLKHLGETERDRHQLRHQLSQTQATLSHTQQELHRTQQELHHQHQAHRHTQSELLNQQIIQQRQHSEIQRYQQTQQQLQAQLVHRQEINQALRIKLNRRQTRIQHLQTQLADLQAHVTWMQSSKFWRMRNVMVSFKQLLGLPTVPQDRQKF